MSSWKKQARTEAAAAVARHTSATRAVAQSEAAVKAEEAALAVALQESGFGGVAAATAAVRTTSQQASLDAEVRRHESEYAAVMARLLDPAPAAQIMDLVFNQCLGAPTG